MSAGHVLCKLRHLELGLLPLRTEGGGNWPTCALPDQRWGDEYAGDAGWAMGYCRHPGCGETLAKQSEKRIDDVNVSM